MVDKKRTPASLGIIDDYEHPNNSVEYILENILSSDFLYKDSDFITLQDEYNSVLMNSCQCSSGNDCTECFHGSNYELQTESGISELVLQDTRRSDLIYECSDLCGCIPGKCTNRLVQFGPRRNLVIFQSATFGSKGLKTTVCIPKGGFICEYAGELLTMAEARHRLKINEESRNMNYILCLKEMAISGEPASRPNITIIDPSRMGNIGRYLNHSCEPNCEIFSVRIDCPIPKVAIFAKRKIFAGEELCFHYNGVDAEEAPSQKRTNIRVPCLCKSPNCKKYLPNVPF